MKKKFTFMMAALMLLLMVLPWRAVGQTTTFVSGSGTSNYAIPEGWTSTGTVEGGTYLKFDDGTITSPQFEPHNELSFSYSVATFGSGTNHPLTIRILNASTNAVIVEKTTATPTTSSYISTDSPLSLGDVAVAFKIQMYGPSGKGVRLRNYSVTGTPAGGGTTPTMSVNPASIDFGNENTINPSEPYTRTFNVTFANLTESLSVTVGSGLTGVSVSPTSIAANATSPQTVTVSYNPTAEGNLSGNITVSSSEVATASVSVSGSAYDPSSVDTYEKYTGALVEGDYIICANAEVAMKNVISGNRFENEAVTVTDNAITNPDASIIWHIAPDGDYWTIYNAAVNKYAAGTNSNNQGTLINNVTDYARWQITYQYSNYTVICYGRNSSNNKYLRRNGDYGWATYTSGTGQVPTFYKKVVANQVATPTFSLVEGTYFETQSVTLSCATDGATIYYTTNGTTPSASNGMVYTTAISVSTTTTIKAIAIATGMTDSDVASATYTIEQPYNTIPALFAAATAAEKDVRVTFDNWVVSGVSTNGRNVYVTDNNGNGFIIYFTSEMSETFAAGDILSGTAVACKLKLYNGAAELVNLTATDLTITSGGTVSISNIPMSDLSGVNTGALVRYNNLICSVSDNKYYLTDGTTTLQAYNTLYAFNEFEDGKTYNVTGVYVQYNSIKEIAPRSADDVVLKANMSSTDLSGLTAFTYILGSGPSDVQTITIIGSDFSGDLTVNAPANYEVSSDNSIWGATATYTPSSGTVGGTLYIRLAANLAAGEYNGSMTFNATNLTTISANLEGTVSANPTYIISLNQTTGGTISADLSVAEEGQIVNLSYTDLDDCYTFNGWTVLDGNADEVPVTNNQFTMPASDVEIEGIFTLKTFTVQYSVNGEIKTALNQTGIDCGDAVSLKTAADISAASIALPTGYTFAGWSTEADNTNIISSLIVSANTTLYAVLLPSGAATSYVKVTSLSDITAGTYFIVSDLYVLPSATTSSAPVMSDDYIIGESLSDTYDTPINGTLWYFTGTKDAMTIKNGDNNYLYTSTQNNGVRVGSTSGTWTFETNSTGFAMKSNNSRYCATTDNSDWRSYSTANSQYYHDGGKIYLYKEVIPTSYTLVEDISTTETLPSIEPTYLITVKDGATLTVTGSSTGDETNLIIEDGGQLKVTDNATVKATVKKTVDDWTGPVASKADNDGWYAISSPVNGQAIAGDNGFVKGTHNVYRYDEPTAYWNEYRSVDVAYPSFSTLENGRGYLYRSTSNEGIEFKGTVNSADVTYPLSFTYDGIYSDLKGFNLVGNPYTHEIALSDMTFVNAFDDGFYLLGEEDDEYKGKWIASTSTTKVAPMRAFLVQAKAGEVNPETHTITIKNNVPAVGKGTNYANDNIMFMVKNAEYSDEAYVLFKKGHGLNKIDHRNAEIPMLYVISEGENYAIADMLDNTDVINLGFEAKTMGQYTISLKAEGQYSYMHLVDKLTGNDIDMLVEDSYTFVGTPNDRNDRFVLRLNYNAAGIDTESDIFAYQSGNDIMVSGEGELQVFDITGRKVMTTDINGVQTVNGLNNGFYIFRLNEKIQKIVVR